MDSLNCDIWCICLQESPERYSGSLAEFKKVGLDKKVKYLRPRRDPRGGRIGCWTSFITCMMRSDSNKHVLIFEDDVFFDGYEKQVDIIKKFLTEEPNWDIFKLGGTILTFNEQSVSSPHVWKSSSLLNQAVIFNRDFVKALLRDPDIHHPERTETHFDRYLIERGAREYILTEPCCYQKGGYGSNIQWKKDFFNNIGQNIVESKYVYEKLQYLNNKVKWNTRFIPVSWQPYTYLILPIFIIIVITIILFITR